MNPVAPDPSGIHAADRANAPSAPPASRPPDEKTRLSPDMMATLASRLGRALCETPPDAAIASVLDAQTHLLDEIFHSLIVHDLDFGTPHGRQGILLALRAQKQCLKSWETARKTQEKTQKNRQTDCTDYGESNAPLDP